MVETGVFVYPCGDTYRGEYVMENGIPLRHGNGVYVAFSEESMGIAEVPASTKATPVPRRLGNDIVRLDGAWQKDVFAEGEITFASGAKYSGKLDGLNYQSGGTYTFPDGTRYTGEFHENMLHGIGTVTGPDGRVHGPGVYRNNYGAGLGK